MKEQFVDVCNVISVINRVKHSLDVLERIIKVHTYFLEDNEELLSLTDFLHSAMRYVATYQVEFNLIYDSVETSMLVKLTRLIIAYVKIHSLVN